MTETRINGIVMSGLAAARPASLSLATPASGPNPSGIYLATDTSAASMWNFAGAAWISLGGGGSGTVTSVSLSAPLGGGTVTTTGTLGTTSFTAHGVVLGEGSSALGVTAALTNGQLLIGSTGADPVPASLTAGANITLTPGAGSLTIAASGGGATYVPPVLANFTYAHQPTSATATAVTGGIQLFSPSIGGGFGLNVLLQATPSTPYTMWMRFSNISALGPLSNIGFALADGTGKLITFSLWSESAGFQLEYDTYSSYTARASVATSITPYTVPPLIGINDDGTNINVLFSYDGVAIYSVFSVSRTAYLTSGPTQIGFFTQGYSQATTVNFVHWSPNLPGPI